MSELTSHDNIGFLSSSKKKDIFETIHFIYLIIVEKPIKSYHSYQHQLNHQFMTGSFKINDRVPPLETERSHVLYKHSIV